MKKESETDWRVIPGYGAVTVYDLPAGGEHANFYYRTDKTTGPVRDILPTRKKAESYAQSWKSIYSRPLQLPSDLTKDPYCPDDTAYYKGFVLQYGFGTLRVPTGPDIRDARESLFASFSYKCPYGSQLITTPLDTALAFAVWTIDNLILPRKAKKEREFQVKKGVTYVIQAKPGVRVYTDAYGMIGHMSDSGELEYTPEVDTTLRVCDRRARLQQTFLSCLCNN